MISLLKLKLENLKREEDNNDYSEIAKGIAWASNPVCKKLQGILIILTGVINVPWKTSTLAVLKRGGGNRARLNYF